MKRPTRFAVLFCLLVLSNHRLIAQPELEPWGNLTGIRVEGQLLQFATSLWIIDADGHAMSTAKERQEPHFSREGETRVVLTRLDSIYFKERVADGGVGTARIDITCTAHADMNLKGIFFKIFLPKGLVRNGPTQWIDRVTRRKLQIRQESAASTNFTLEEEAGQDFARIDIPLKTGAIRKDETVQLTFTITTSGDIDRQPIQLVLNTSAPGRPFDGIGGNFRIQNTRLDPQVIDYCLQHLPVAWGRVELPWRLWQPDIAENPLDSEKIRSIHPAVQRAMEMAHVLGEKNIPFILSAWFPPDWAIIGPVRFQPGPDHIWGNPLNHSNDAAIYKSIADYIVYLKQHYGVEPKYFSFNESDLGINVRQSAEEHDALIKGLGAYFAAHGLTTRVLLGDNSDATTWQFIGPAMDDPAARPWLAAISFHSWRGWDTATLQKWSDASTKLRLPLLVGEGSIDAAAWHYPAILGEPSYALNEIGLYTRLLAICQPASILQWQLTSDYSLLAGGGIFGDTGTLRPTQRFWNLKQLSMTPRGLFAMPLSCDRPGITVAALGDNQKHLYVLHLVNDAASREVLLKGLPPTVRNLRIYTTNGEKSAVEGAPIRVTTGEARFTLEARSFVTLIGQ